VGWFVGSAVESVSVRGSFYKIHGVASRAFNAQSNRSLNHTTSIALYFIYAQLAYLLRRLAKSAFAHFDR
jgi:hypothetical protein